MSETTVVAWSGELLWPQDLPEAEVIDVSGVTAIGSWLHAWFRAHPDQAVTGANPAIRRQLAQAAVPVVWSDHPHKAPNGGVSAGERALLWGDERGDGRSPT